MLLTALEIIAFMVAASIIGVVLGWVLRGTLGNEQVEISDLRAQLRKLKKANRESKSAMAATNNVSSEAAAPASAPAKVAASAAAKPAVMNEIAKAEPSTAKAKKPAARKKPAAKKKTSTKAGKNASARKSLAEREADQAAGKKAFVDVVSRVGKEGANDNLTRIYGIGKKYAGMLNDLDITSYAQISKLRKADVRTLAAALGVLDDRLETEDWVASAKKLMKEAKK